MKNVDVIFCDDDEVSSLLLMIIRENGKHGKQDRQDGKRGLGQKNGIVIMITS